jgi:CHAT domain-containing protein
MWSTRTVCPSPGNVPPATTVSLCAGLILLGLSAACGVDNDRLDSEAIGLARRADASQLVMIREKLQRRCEARRRAADRGAEARCLEALAEVTDALNDAPQALSLFAAGAAIEESHNPGHAGRIKARMALVYLDTEDSDRAERFADEALTQATLANDSVGRARALFARAEVQFGRDLPARARGNLREALALFRAAGEQSWAGRALQQLSDCAAMEGQEDESRRFAEESLAVFRKIGDRRGEATALNQLSDWFDQFPQDYPTGLRHAIEAAQIARRTGDLRLLAVYLDAIGVAERMQDHFASALPYHREALELHQLLHDRRGEAETRFSFGTALRHLGRLDEAIEMLRASVALFHQASTDDREGTAMWQLARALQIAGRLEEATVLADRSLALRESLRNRIAVVRRRASYSDQIRAHYDLAVGLRMQRAAARPDRRLTEEALILSERARARSLLDTLALAEVRAGNNPVARQQASVQHDVELLEEQLDDSTAAEQRMRLEGAIDASLAEYATLQDRLEGEQPSSRPLEPMDRSALSRIQATLDRETVLLEYYLGSVSSGSLAWVITHDQVIGAQLGAPEPIESAARALYSSLTTSSAARNMDQADAQIYRQAAELGKRVLAPIAKLLAGKHRLVVVPDGALGYVPFGLLPDERGAPLAFDRELYDTPSLTVLDKMRRRRSQATRPTAGLVIYSDPVFSANDARIRGADPPAREGAVNGVAAQPGLTRALADVGLVHLPRLPFSRQEASTIASLMPPDSSSLRLGFAAQKQTIVDGALKGYRWIHLATHGILDSSHPERSGLVFSRFDEAGKERDGYLRLSEIYDLTLSADLVVLSACQTALGREVRRDGLISLTRGFLHAGAQRVLATLWPVDDEATSQLMRRFYRAMLVERMSPGLALAHTKRSMRDDPRFNAPYYWAGFVLYGDWQRPDVRVTERPVLH